RGALDPRPLLRRPVAQVHGLLLEVRVRLPAHLAQVGQVAATGEDRDPGVVEVEDVVGAGLALAVVERLLVPGGVGEGLPGRLYPAELAPLREHRLHRLERRVVERPHHDLAGELGRLTGGGGGRGGRGAGRGRLRSGGGRGRGRGRGGRGGRGAGGRGGRGAATAAAGGQQRHRADAQAA